MILHTIHKNGAVEHIQVSRVKEHDGAVEIHGWRERDIWGTIRLEHYDRIMLMDDLGNLLSVIKAG